jgi:hypothetical protein
MENLARNILDPEKCQSVIAGVAACPTALQLEAIGDDAIPYLKDALSSDSFDVRFQAAQSLAYLGDASGVDVLLEAARDQPAFRVYALVALSVVDDADSVLALRQLMSEEALETRYGAFRALKELDPHDPSLNPIVFENRFVMYVVESAGEPMVHVTRRRAPEIVVFGVDQPLRLPAVLNAGRNIRIMGETGKHEVEVIYYQLNAEPQRQKVPNRLIDIVRVCGKLGATYPDMVQMMIEAEQQHNFVGQFGIDRLPQAGRLYMKKDEIANGDDDVKRIGSPKMIPELFDELDEDELLENESAEKLMSLNFDEVAKEDAKNGAAVSRNKAEKPASRKNNDIGSSRTATDAKHRSSTDNADENSSNDVSDEDLNLLMESSNLDKPDSKVDDTMTDDSNSFSEEADEDDEDVLAPDTLKPPKESFGQRFLGVFRRPSISGMTEPEE